MVDGLAGAAGDTLLLLWAVAAITATWQGDSDACRNEKGSNNLHVASERDLVDGSWRVSRVADLIASECRPDVNEGKRLQLELTSLIYLHSYLLLSSLLGCPLVQRAFHEGVNTYS